MAVVVCLYHLESLQGGGGRGVVFLLGLIQHFTEGKIKKTGEERDRPQSPCWL